MQLGSTLFGHRAAAQQQTEIANAAEQGEVLFLVAVLYAALQLLLVILVCPPLGRMTDAAAVLLPMVLANFLVTQNPSPEVKPPPVEGRP